jgi:hypothetical protein
MRGEVRFPNALVVDLYPDADERSAGFLANALARAAEGNCEAAESEWLRARRTVPKNYLWHDNTQDETVGPALSVCWSELANAKPDDAVDYLTRAHRWDHRNDTFLEASAPVADRLYAEGLKARKRGDADGAYHYFTQTLAIQPTRSWARRYAEEARNERLDLGPLKLFGRVKRNFEREPAP